MNHAASLARAHDLLRQRRFAEAEAACLQVLEQAPRQADAVHMLGLIRKDVGDVAGGEQLLRHSLELAPTRGEFHANLANLLRRERRLGDALVSYRAALALQPSHRAARLSLAWTLRDLGDQSAAEAECRTLLAGDARDAQAWTALATVLRQQQRSGEAEAAYRKAIALQPNYAAARHNLGALLCQQERAQEALAELDRAQALGVHSRELWLNRGHALLKLDQATAAEQAYARAVELEPQDPEAQLDLARLRYMLGDPAFDRSMRAAVRSLPGALPLQLTYARLLRCCGDLYAAETHLQRLTGESAAAAEAHCALAGVLQEQGQLVTAEHHAQAAVDARPDSTTALESLIALRLALGRIDSALPLIHAQRTRNPNEQRWLAYESLAARLSGDPWYGELCDYGELVRSYDLAPPSGWRSMDELNAALLQALTKRHLFARHPFDQSLRNGSQTTSSLLASSDPAIRAVLDLFTAAAADYADALGAADDHPFRLRNRGVPRIDKCWSVQLHREGYHVNHIHPEGWISSAYYVSVPEETRDEVTMSGWIKFGEPSFAIAGCGIERCVQPRAGRLVLFPSYIWHGTTPIHGAELRTTIAFDALPDGR